MKVVDGLTVDDAVNVMRVSYPHFVQEYVHSRKPFLPVIVLSLFMHPSLFIRGVCTYPNAGGTPEWHGLCH